jgi:hypothetical protein
MSAACQEAQRISSIQTPSCYLQVEQRKATEATRQKETMQQQMSEQERGARAAQTELKAAQAVAEQRVGAVPKCKC